MTREEAIEELERLLRHWDDLENGKRCFWGYDEEAVAVALSTLRPVSREWVGKVWRGEWEEERFAGEFEGWQHKDCGRHSTVKSMWCPKCGKAMTDEAVQMVMERLEALNNEG